MGSDLPDDVRYFPTLPGTYFDPSTNLLSLPPSPLPPHFVDGCSSLASVELAAAREEEDRQRAVEMSGCLSRRCIEGLRADGTVEREFYETIKNARGMA